MTTSCVILDLQSYELSQEESELLKHPCVAGIILFMRNYYDLAQLQALTAAIQKVRPDCIIAVDQEGGRVQRFRKDFTHLASMSSWGEKYQQDATKAKHELATAIKISCHELLRANIRLNFVPVLDLSYGINDMIGERSLHQDPEVVIDLAAIIVDCLHECGMPAVGKHFPGHGGVSIDSHLALPTDERSWAQIYSADLKPFMALIDQLDIIMTAHIVFKQCDEQLVTYSHFWLQKILREHMQFKGVIISDDLSMLALASIGDYPERASQALTAGIDLLLICNNRIGAIAAIESLERRTVSASQKQRLHQLRHKYGWY